MVNPLRSKRNSGNRYQGSSGKYTAEAIERDFKTTVWLRIKKREN